MSVYRTIGPLVFVLCGRKFGGDVPYSTAIPIGKPRFPLEWWYNHGGVMDSVLA